MPRTNDTRSKMVASAALLIREKGVSGTSFEKVVRHSGSSRGSIGHHFPGGKDEMVRDAIGWAGDIATQAMQQGVEQGNSSRTIFESVAGFYRAALIDSNFTAGCPVGAVAQERHGDEGTRLVLKSTFDDWRRVITASLIAEGKPEAQAADLAELCVASVEGAILVARIDRDARPIDSVVRQVGPLLGKDD
jgi:AcrR family transcriptional regulator